ncbi:MAG TPA: lysylphosphatidylglycerol synthase transmembrane domain-containing protein [Puia sp.]|nr:lysylphosphatidylglycerol synthase transmembrane domain-containing protein [Puia sp.]
MFLNKNIKIIINYLFGPIIFLLLVFAIYKQLLAKANWQGSLKQIIDAITGKHQWKIWLVCIFMFFNWGTEARKWQLSIAQVQHITWWRAFKATLTGSTLACFTPNRTGEYFGRMLYIQEGKRAQTVSLTIIGSISQIMVTMIIGGIGIVFFKKYTITNNLLLNPDVFYSGLNILLSIVVIAFILLVIFYFKLSWLVNALNFFRLPGKYLVYVKISEGLKTGILLRILSLSFLRYCIFILQYYLMFEVFNVPLTFLQTLNSISIVFLVMAVAPTFTVLTELGLRWAACVQVVQLFSTNVVGIMAASFGIWFINLVIPALAGSLLILGVKLFKNK